MELQKKRLTADEYNALICLTGIISGLSNSLKPMEIRSRLTPHGYKFLRIARGMLIKAFDEIIKTVPIEKLQTLKRDLKHVQTTTRITYSGKKAEDNYRWIRGEAIDALIAYVAQYNCGMCDKCGSEISKCEARKYINECYPFDIAIARNGVCSMSGCFTAQDCYDLAKGNIEADQEENDDTE